MTHCRALRILPLFIGMVFCLLLSGCSGLDHLRVTNHYPFEVYIWENKNHLIGVVPSGKSVTFNGAAGYHGRDLDGVQYTNKQDKTLGTFHRNDANMMRESVSAFNGTATWSVTIGPPKSASPDGNTFSDLLMDNGGMGALSLIVGILVWKVTRRIDKPAQRA